MNLIHTKVLTGCQINDIKTLVESCCLQEPLTLSAPSEDGLDYYLAYEDDRLLSMMFLFFPEKTVCECGAFTAPDARKKGYFSALLQQALTFVDSKEEALGVPIDFCFLTDGHSIAASGVLHALGADYWYSEYGMERSLSSSDCTYHSHLTIQDAGEYLYTASLNGQIIGVSMVIPSGDSAYFYGFEIKEGFRGCGYGTDFLLGMLAYLSAAYRHITLQVSQRNTAALSLYTKTGFCIKQTLSYYLY